MVARPLQIARGGESTFSITRLNGSSCPLASRFARSAMISSNLLNRSVIDSLIPFALSLSKGSTFLSPLPNAKRSFDKLRTNGVWGSFLQFLHRIDQLAEVFDLGLLVHRDDDVELVLDRGDEIFFCLVVVFVVGRDRGR